MDTAPCHGKRKNHTNHACLLRARYVGPMEGGAIRRPHCALRTDGVHQVFSSTSNSLGENYGGKPFSRKALLAADATDLSPANGGVENRCACNVPASVTAQHRACVNGEHKSSWWVKVASSRPRTECDPMFTVARKCAAILFRISRMVVQHLVIDRGDYICLRSVWQIVSCGLM